MSTASLGHGGGNIVLGGLRYLCRIMGVHLQLLLGIHEPADFTHRGANGAWWAIPTADPVAFIACTGEKAGGDHRPGGRKSRECLSHRHALAWGSSGKRYAGAVLHHGRARVL